MNQAQNSLHSSYQMMVPPSFDKLKSYWSIYILDSDQSALEWWVTIDSLEIMRLKALSSLVQSNLKKTILSRMRTLRATKHSAALFIDVLIATIR